VNGWVGSAGIINGEGEWVEGLSFSTTARGMREGECFGRSEHGG
jgi:hypothetical protein